MNSPKVSIIMANYNYGRYIADALRSVQNQTLQDWECIVIDDGSLDDSVRIIEKFVRNDNRFRMICQKNRGIAMARNAGLDAARGEYIAFLDADDCYVENALETLLHLAKISAADIVGGSVVMVPSFFQYEPTHKADFISMELFDVRNTPHDFFQAKRDHKWCWIWRRLYKRSLIGDTRFVPEFTQLGEDSYFIMDVAWRTRFMAECANTVVFHRYHPRAITVGEFSQPRAEWYLTYVKKVTENLSDKYDDKFYELFWQDLFPLLLKDLLILPQKLRKLQPECKEILIQCCKLIPRRYLTWRQRILCRFISCLK